MKGTAVGMIALPMVVLPRENAIQGKHSTLHRRLLAVAERCWQTRTLIG